MRPHNGPSHCPLYEDVYPLLLAALACPSLSSVAHGAALDVTNGGLYPARADYRCADGHRVSGTSSSIISRFCRADADHTFWDGPEPICEGV